MHNVEPLLRDTKFPSIVRGQLQSLQVNLGYLCNLSCTHCHVNAGPKRTELMGKETIEQLLAFMDRFGITQLDLTGGAPEMNPHFKYFVTQARDRNIDVIDRCNLTILLEPGYEDMAQFLADHRVTISASLPCYEEKNVNEQRGKGVYQSSIEALKILNDLGYGVDARLKLDLVYNPNGAFLPPAQQPLQADYKQQLQSQHGIVFNELLTITNMPISRFGSMLISKGELDDYLNLLKQNFAQDNLQGVMCKSLISVDWQGFIYDCDFNQMLDWPLIRPLNARKNVLVSDKPKVHISDILNHDLTGNQIVIGEHCYGCTAGQGSSCGGALSDS